MPLSPEITARLPHCRAVNSSDKVTFCCPIHADEHQSAVAFPRDDGGVTLHCSAGCDPRQIASVLGIDTRGKGGKSGGGSGRGSYGAGRKHGAKRLDFGPKTPTTTFGRSYMKSYGPCKGCGDKGCKKPGCTPCNAGRNNVTPHATDDDDTADDENLPEPTDPTDIADIEAVPADDSLFHLAARFAQQAVPEALGVLAAQLGVAADALEEIGLGWNHLPADRRQSRSGGVTILPPCWTFPEKDGAGNVVGIGERYSDGKKKFMFGTNRGLIYSDSLYDMVRACGYVLLVEGPTDTAACLSIGLPAVGRPSNTGGVAQLADLIHRLFHDFPNLRIIVVGENDQRAAGNWPGMLGANETAIKLRNKLIELTMFNPDAAGGPTVEVAFPPADIKDMRSWVNQINPDYSDKNSKTACANAVMAAILGGLLQFKLTANHKHSTNCNTLYDCDTSPYEERHCKRGSTQVNEGINVRVGQVAVIFTRCGKATCQECWPTRIGRWLVRAFGRLVTTAGVGDNLYLYNIDSDVSKTAISMRVRRAGAEYVLINVGTHQELITTAEVPSCGDPRIINDASDLFVYLHKTIASIPFGTSRAITMSHRPKAIKEPKVPEWRHFGQVAGNRYDLIKSVILGAGFAPVASKLGGDKVISYHLFRFPDHFDAATRELHLRWLMLGQRPPSCGRMPNGWDILQVWQPVHGLAAT